jgi:hypothetical protein
MFKVYQNRCIQYMYIIYVYNKRFLLHTFLSAMVRNNGQMTFERILKRCEWTFERIKFYLPVKFRWAFERNKITGKYR